jgi:hypothetical protein
VSGFYSKFCSGERASLGKPATIDDSNGIGRTAYDDWLIYGALPEQSFGVVVLRWHNRRVEDQLRWRRCRTFFTQNIRGEDGRTIFMRRGMLWVFYSFALAAIIAAGGVSNTSAAEGSTPVAMVDDEIITLEEIETPLSAKLEA